MWNPVIGELPSNGGVHEMVTKLPLVKVVGATGELGACAASIGLGGDELIEEPTELRATITNS